ncbi:MAG: hypothetical protein ABSF33_12480 [Acidimicrobiales bacterium]
MSRPQRAPARRAALEASGHLERTEMWNGLHRGDPVIVSGLHLRAATWEFRAHVRNRHNDTESIEVVGGRPGDRRIRSFEPSRIFAVTAGRRRRADADRSIAGQLSLAEAPQLPLE